MCQTCGWQQHLPNRAALVRSPAGASTSPNDPGRLAQLRAQDCGMPQLPATLVAVLGGPEMLAGHLGSEILPGRVQEALAIWQSLRKRAQSGDVGASNDLMLLTMLLADAAPFSNGEMETALYESALDASVLPSHKQRLLGLLCRTAVGRGNVEDARGFLSYMDPYVSELAADSSYRLSAAAVATVSGAPQEVLALLGTAKDQIPIADNLDPVASIFRANAYELLGNVAAAVDVLRREIPDTRRFVALAHRYSKVPLCALSGARYLTLVQDASVQQAAARARGPGLVIGGLLAFVGITVVVPSMIVDGVAMMPGSVIGGILFVVGMAVVLRSLARARRATWLRLNGLGLTGRIVAASSTGMTVNGVPSLRFELQVAGPAGAYTTSFTRLVPEHKAALMIGQEVQLRANPANLTEVILEE